MAMFSLQYYLTSDCIVTGIDLHEKHGVNVFPNPFKNIINIELEHATKALINIYSTSGSLIYSNVPDSRFLKIDMSNFSQGMYIVKVIQDKRVYNEKVLSIR